MSSFGPRRYDAFLSYNAQEHPVVRDLAGRLEREGLVLYFEEWELAAGRDFQPALAVALGESKACVVFLGPNGLGPWQKQEIQVALDRHARDEAYHVIPVLLPGAERPRRGDVAHLEFLINASWVEFPGTLDDAQAFRRLMGGITGIPSREPAATAYEGVCPYRGLEAFRPEDEPFFCGRENLTGWLVSALRREVRAAEGLRFLGVLGPSGSGKSSVVLAGLVPRLKVGAIPGSERWPVAILRPGDDPLRSLTEKLVPRIRDEVRCDASASELQEQSELLDFLRSDGEDATTPLDSYLGLKFSGEPDDRRLLIVVDQFEEVFTYRPQDDRARERFERDRDCFLANLLNAAARPGGRAAVVLTMRSDFLGACAPFPQLSAVLAAHQELVGPMTAAELREAIERPAFLVGCEVEPALAERLLADVGGQPGALPLLQFALTEVWKRRDVRRLTLRAYTELGKDDKGQERGIEGVLDHRANEIYRTTMTAEEQDVCRRLFLRLVQPGEGTEDTKRRVPLSELLPDDPARAQAVRKLVQALARGDTRLIATDEGDESGGVVEVAHEALIRGWGLLRRWVNDERAGLRTHRRLTDDAKEWEAAAESAEEDLLYRTTRLANCREWAATHRDELNPIEAAFLAASEEAEERRKLDELREERRRRAEAEAHEREARAAADRQRRARNRFAIAAVFAGALALACGVLAMWVSRERGRAEARRRVAQRQTRLAEAGRLASQSVEACTRTPVRSILLAVEAIQATRRSGEPAVPAAVQALRDALAVAGGRVVIASAARAVAFGPDGCFVTANETSAKIISASGNLVGEYHLIDSGEEPAKAVAISRDGRRIASGYANGVVRVWDATTTTTGVRPPPRASEVASERLHYTADGHWLASDDLSRAILIRGVADARTLPPHSGEVGLLAFSDNGRWLASRDGEGTVRIWNLSLPDPRPVILPNRPRALASLAVSDDGRKLALGYPGGRFEVSNPDERRPLGQPPASGDGSTKVAVAFETNTLVIATANYVRTETLIESHMFGAEVVSSTLGDLESPITAVAISPEGGFVVTGHLDGTLRIMSRSTLKPISTARGHEGAHHRHRDLAGRKMVAHGQRRRDGPSLGPEARRGRTVRTGRGHRRAAPVGASDRAGW
jgi:hypothetical protein